jgi:hypothetical protein
LTQEQKELLETLELISLGMEAMTEKLLDLVAKVDRLEKFKRDIESRLFQ